MARGIALSLKQLSLHSAPMKEKVTTQRLRKLKGQRPIVCLTAYDAIMGRLADEAGADLLLVGDSVGTTQLGFETTVPVTLDMMVHHTAAVARTRPKALLVADVPFAVAHQGVDGVLNACTRLMQEGGAEAVKIEGGSKMAQTIERLVDAGIPVLGHIGLLPQRFHALGGYRKFGRTEHGRAHLLSDALALQQAGVFAIIGEMIQADSSAELTRQLGVPFIGIGCGHPCDGQILVSNDVLGLGTGHYPSFVKQYAQLAETVKSAFAAYADEVRKGIFPETAKSEPPKENS